MLKSFSVACLFALLLAVFLACGSDGKNDASQPSSQSAASKPEEQHEYRAVCIEKEAHGGNEAILSRWVDSKEKAEAQADAHSEDNGHRTRIDERVKPASVPEK